MPELINTKNSFYHLVHALKYIINSHENEQYYNLNVIIYQLCPKVQD